MKIRAKDLKTPKFFYTAYMIPNGQFRHLEIRIRKCIGSHSKIVSPDDVISITWQLNREATSNFCPVDTAFTAYGASAEIPLGSSFASPKDAVMVLNRILNGQSWSQLKPKDVMRILKRMRIRRYQITSDYQWIPRKYRRCPGDFITARDLMVS